MSDLMTQLTIVVPTHNRYPRLLRLLRYYGSFRCQAQVSLLDSSEGNLPQELTTLISQAGGIKRWPYPSTLSPLAKILDGLGRVTTPYVVLWADDDFMVPGAFEEGVHLLERDPSVSVVHGQSGLFHVEQGSVRWVDPYPQASVTEEKAADRLQHYLGAYTVTFYSIARTDRFRRNLERVICQFALDWHTWGEMALGALAVIQGKAMAMPRLYLLKEGHQDMHSLRDLQGWDADVFDWLTSSTFARERGSYEQFRDCVVPELVQHDGLSVEEAQGVIKRAFWPYVVQQMHFRWYGLEPRGIVQRRLRNFRKTARRIPGLQRTWRRAQRILPHRKETISLPALLQRRSPYHQDFMPIYQAITAGNGR